MKKKFTYTKVLITIILSIAIVDLQLTYLLAYLGKEQIAESLGVAIVTEILGVTMTYCAKAYFETKEEEKIRLEEEKISNMGGEE